MQTFITRCGGLCGATIFAIVAVTATAALGGTVSHGDFTTSTVNFRDVTESGTDIPPGLFVPPSPVASASGSTAEISFFPNRFIITDQSLSFDLKSLSSQLGLFVAGRTVGSTAYQLKSLNLNVQGAYDLYAPFDNIPPTGAASVAQVQMSNVPLSIQVTGVNWAPYAGGSPYAASMTVTPSTVTAVGPSGTASGVWNGSHAVSWAALRAAAGILPTDFITELQIQAPVSIHAASMYGRAQASVTNFDAQTNTDPVAVPEPPTVILAGLGVAAAVGHGYRRRKIRRVAGTTAGADDLNGAIAVTA